MDFLTIIIETYGYIGCVLVVVSMVMTSVVKLRVVNTIGSVVSGTYSLIIGSYPMVLMNAAIIVINVWALWSLMGKKNNKYDYVRCNCGDGSLQYFLNLYQEDINVYFPNFRQAITNANVAFCTFCGSDHAGVLMGRLDANGNIQVLLDYTTGKYRDCSIGKFMFAELPKEGVENLIVLQPSDKHKGYLEKTGYHVESGRYVKHLGK